MNTYRARFTAQAEVVFEITLKADNQQEGIINAHDLIAKATAEQAKVVHVIPETVKNVEFESMDVASDELPPGPFDRSNEFSIEVFSGQHCSGPLLFKVPVDCLDGAKRILATTLKGTLSSAGSAKISDFSGLQVMSANAERGGWEVEVFASSQSISEATTRHTWQSSQSEALRLAVSLLSKNTGQVIRILDFTNRLAGPKLWREIG